MSEVDFDVGIVGGGPAGAAMGAYLARAGVRCVIFERAIFPRPHVGESLVPSSTRIFQELGFLPVMEELGFPHKYGALWTSGPRVRPYTMDWDGFDPTAEPTGAPAGAPAGARADGKPATGVETRAPIRFDERPQPGVSQSYTYHVDRAKFDLALLQHAHAAGCKVYEGMDVRHVGVPARDGAVEIACRLGRRDVPVTVRLVADASGRRTLLGGQLKLKVKDPVFDQYALHTWFEDFDRGPGDEAGYIHIHFLPLTNAWVWQIPIDDHVTSVGVVTQRKNFLGSKQDREAFFWSCLRSREDLGDRAAKARMVRPLTEEGDYSYAMTQVAGDGFVLLGDAARFVDPIFSTGVSIALNSARFASRDVLAALERGTFDRGAFSTYEETMGRGVRHWYEFICVYYRLNVLFSYFVQNPKYRLDVLKLLQGDVYEEEAPEVLRLMRAKVEEVEQNPGHMWHRALGDLTANVFRDAAAGR
jgi:flavin-dependent dehydrogenase